MAADQTLSKLFQEYWTWRLSRSPEFATLAGNKDHDDKLETWTVARFTEDFETCKKFIKRSEEELKESDLSESNQLYLKLFRAELQTFIDGYHCGGFYNPVHNIEGVQVDFARLADWMSPSTVKDFENLIARYEKFPTQAGEICDMLRLSVKEKKTNHHYTMFNVLGQFSKHEGSPTSTVFWQPFINLPADFGLEVAKGLQGRAEAAIRDCVQPSMAKIAKCIAQEYLPHTRQDVGVSSLPNGSAFYDQCLKFHTSSAKYTAKVVHETGLSEVSRIEADMQKVFKEIGFTGSLQEFVTSLRKNPKFTFSSGKEMFDRFSQIIFEMIQPKLKEFFLSEPASKLNVTETPPDQTSAPAAYYIAGTSDGSRPGKVFVNCSGAETRLKCQLISLALHEANPGHHLQASYMLSRQGLPEFLKVMEDRNYFQAPSRFPINTAYCEGWALYCEKLGFDMGLYDDPYDRLGHYSEEMFRACRLVVDTGLHAFGWSRDQAIHFMLDHTATPEQEIEIEINRYIGWPGQAVGYKIGELRISELRRKAEKALGDKFDIRQFHEVVLRAAGPLDLLEEEVDTFIKRSL